MPSPIETRGADVPHGRTARAATGRYLSLVKCGPALIVALGVILLLSALWLAVSMTLVGGLVLSVLGSFLAVLGVILARADGRTKVSIGRSAIETDLHNPLNRDPNRRVDDA